jgi:hypothetical protein
VAVQLYTLPEFQSFAVIAKVMDAKYAGTSVKLSGISQSVPDSREMFKPDQPDPAFLALDQ